MVQPSSSDSSPEPEPTEKESVDYREFRARLDKRDDFFADPTAQHRHQTALIVKKTELSPGELAALRGTRRRQTLATLTVVLLVAAGSVALVYSPWLAPPKPQPPPPEPEPVYLPPTETPPTPAPATPTKPLFAPIDLHFNVVDPEADFRAVVTAVGEWRFEQGALVAPAHGQGSEISWLKREFRGDLLFELELAVDALPDQPEENAREFQIVFGGGEQDRGGVYFRVPSRIGKNHGDVLDHDGQETASYGHNRYGWPFNPGQMYRLKVARHGDKLTISRDGETIFVLYRPEAETRRIGILPVSGARILLLKVESLTRLPTP